MPFGEEIGAGVGTRSSELKYSASGLDTIRKRFTGYEKDPETGLDFAEARMYQNKHGRFTAVDPLMASASPGDPQTFNRYTYTGNNPVNRTDPMGLKWCSGKVIYWNNGQCNGNDEDITGKQRSVTAGCAKREGSTEFCIENPSEVFFDSNGTARVVPPTPQQPIKQNQTVAVGTQAVASTPAGSAAAGAMANVSSTSGGTGSGVVQLPANGTPTIVDGLFPCQRLLENCSAPSSSGSLSTSNNEELKTVEAIKAAYNLCSIIPGVGSACAIASAVVSAGQGNFGESGTSVLMVIPGLRQVKASGTVFRATEEVVENKKIIQGIYEFVSETGEIYVGQSGNIPARIKQHLASGKLLPESLSSVKATEVLGGKTTREIAEQLRILAHGGIKKLSNERNPIGKAREYLLNGL